MKILSTRGIGSEIEDIVKYAEKEITLVSPYLKIEKHLFNLICIAGKRGVQIKIIYGKSELIPLQLKKCQSIPNCTLYFNKVLHAKAYYNESHAVLSSMNLYEFSESNNLELGFVCSKKKDEKIFHDILREVDVIIESSEVRHNTAVCEITEKIGEHIKRKNDFEIKDFPKKHITLNSNYGIATFEIDYRHFEVDTLKMKNQFEFIETLQSKGFRLYWNDKGLCLYDQKKSVIKRKKNTPQIIDGIKTLNELIKIHIN